MYSSVRTEYSTIWSKLLVMHLFFSGFYLFVLYFWYFTDSIIWDLLFGLVTISLITYPIALYHDRKFIVSQETEWSPTAWYYVGFILGPIGFGATSLYLGRRDKYLNVWDRFLPNEYQSDEESLD